MTSNYRQPLVTVVIPTWKRHDLLFETLEHLDEQTYKLLEVIIVCDGQDPELVMKFDDRYRARYEHITTSVYQSVHFIELGRNWSGLDRSSFGIAPLLVGYLCAAGEYVMPWCDDERALVDDHIENLVTMIESPCIEPDWTNSDERLVYPDFVYPRVKIWRNGNPDGPETKVIGTSPPKHGQITHYMFRPSNFIKFGYPDWGTHPVDWSLIEKWMKNGANWTMIDEVTFEHRLDQ